MDHPADLDAARHAFVDAVTCHDQYAPTITRETAELMAKSICKTSNMCTNANIQHSKGLILAGVLTLPSRTAALKDYLTTLSKSCSPRDLESRIDTTKPGDENEGLGRIINGKVQQPPQPAFKRLHLLYLLHDLIMSIHAHDHDRESYWSLRNLTEHLPVFEQLRPLASVLARLAACGCNSKVTSTLDAVLEVVSIWRANGVLSFTVCDDILQDVRAASGTEWDAMLSDLASEEAKARAKGQIEDGFDWVIPDRHSAIDDPNAPWHELPAANGLYMKRTRGFPLRAGALPDGGFALDEAGYRADAELRSDVNALYKQIVRGSEKYTDADEVQDVDALGNVVWKDADRPTRNYWGWTLGGIETRKALAARFAGDATGYNDLPATRPAGVNSAVERAKALAAERNANGSGLAGDAGSGYDFGRGGFRGGGRGSFSGSYRGDFRGGHRGRPRW